ncbi:hypothetical protein Droror1_Dr00026988 [Drosera rotundifolia]
MEKARVLVCSWCLIGGNATLRRALARNPRSLQLGKLFDVVDCCFLNLVSANQPGVEVALHKGGFRRMIPMEIPSRFIGQQFGITSSLMSSFLSDLHLSI